MVKLPLCFEAGSAASVFRQVLDDMSLTGSAEGITEQGELLFKENGKIHRLRYGDVSIKKI